MVDMATPGSWQAGSWQVDGRFEEWMGLALVEARSALLSADVPIGAVVLNADGVLLGVGRNAREARGDATAHAEIEAIRAASEALGSWRLVGCSLVVTLEPCTMCAGALVLARVSRLVFGAWDPKAGAAGSVRDVVRDRRLNHTVEVVPAVREAECADLLREFFAAQR
jgi:tRNA(adenine34) deaminase